MNRATFAVAFIVAFLLSIVVVLSPRFGASPQLFPAATLVFLPTFVFTFAPWFRLARLGNYLKQSGQDSLAKRTAFRTRQDHFLLDFSIGQWFQHGSFALGYAGLVTLYFWGWFLLDSFLFPLSIPLLGIFFLVARRNATRLLSPYNPKDVASQIERIYPPKSLRMIAANPPLFTIGLLYLFAVGYFTQNQLTFVLLASPYAVLLLYLRVIRPRFQRSNRKKSL